MKRLIWAIVGLGLIGIFGFWMLTMPAPISATTLAAALAAHPPDIKNGQNVFLIGGCASCHATKGAKGADRMKLSGGQELATPFGIFRVPNISPDATTGIGTWTIGDIVNAVLTGVSPDGRHYYPAFPYSSYARLKIDDAIDLAGYLKTLPAVVNKVADHTLPFPFGIRRGIGLWKRLYVSTRPIVALSNPSETISRGQYLVEGPGHCGECHTPRGIIGGPDLTRWLAGAPLLERPVPGKSAGRSPDITPDPKALGPWSAGDITYYLEAGFTPDGDAVGGAMADVVENTAAIAKADREAIAAYLKAIPPLAPVAIP